MKAEGNSERFQKSPFLWISTFDSVFEDLHFCGAFLQISVSTFTKRMFSLLFCTKTEQCEWGLRPVFNKGASQRLLAIDVL